jgi:hypothetical protein
MRPAKVKSHCPDLRVEYNVGRVFVDGMTTPFDFLVTPLRDGIEDLCVSVEARDLVHRVTLRDRRECPEIPVPGEALEIYIDFLPPPGMHGQVSFEFRISYTCEGCAQAYVARRRHIIHPSREEARISVGGNLIIDNRVDAEIHQGHASDAEIKVGDGGRGLSEFLRRTSPESKADAVTKYCGTVALLAATWPIAL